MKKSFALAAGLLAISAVAHCQDVIPSMGLASQYSIFGLGNTQMGISSGTTQVFGNLALGAGSRLDFSGGATVFGTGTIDPTSQAQVSGGSSFTQGSSVANLSQAVQDAINASNQAAADKATETFNNIDGSISQINATGAVSVFDVTGNVHLSGGTLTLNGSKNDYFIFNVNGGYETSGGTNIALTGGLTANHILWNFIGSGSQVQFSGHSTEEGTFLAVERDIAANGGIVNGALIGAQGHQLSLQSHPIINGQPTPEPMTALVILPGLLLFRRKRSGQATSAQ